YDIQREGMMGRTTARARLVLDAEEKERLTRLSQSRTAPGREIERACVLLKYAEGKSLSDIHRELGLSRPSIYKCIDKA
ncbi:transposase, partial [mine drainage metagenome]